MTNTVKNRYVLSLKKRVRPNTWIRGTATQETKKQYRTTHGRLAAIKLKSWSKQLKHGR